MSGIFGASREAVVSAIMGVGRMDAMRAMWGDGFDPLLDYLGLALPPQDVGLDMLREAVAREPVCSTMVFSGERCSGDDLTNGTDSPILLGLAEVMAVLAPVSCMQSEGRNGREANGLALVLSGGVTITPQMGELPADVMIRQFNGITGGVYSAVIGADSCSLNTGDQGRVLAGLAFARRPKRLVFAHVRDHDARFAATIVYALKQMVDAENRGLDALIARLREQSPDDPNIGKAEAAKRVMPEVLFVAFGGWEDRDPRRGRDNGGEGITRAREAFGPMQTAEEEMCPKKALGCEYANRYGAEQDPTRNFVYACAALSPSEMIALIPPWVKDYMGYSAAA